MKEKEILDLFDRALKALDKQTKIINQNSLQFHSKMIQSYQKRGKEKNEVRNHLS